jgi:hypothetical protein
MTNLSKTTLKQLGKFVFRKEIQFCANAFFALDTLGLARQIELILSVLRCSRRSGQEGIGLIAIT